MEVSRGRVGSDQYTNHQHSVSGDISYAGSSLCEFHSPQNRSPTQNINFRSSTSSSREGSLITASWLPVSSKRRCTVRETASSRILGPLSPQSLSAQQEATSRSSISYSPVLSNQVPQASKSAYPLVFYNPLSDCENLDVSSLDRMTNEEDQNSSSHWPDDNSSIEHKFQKNLTTSQLETSSDPSASFRREGFRWSCASSNDLGLDREKDTMMGQIYIDDQRSTKTFASDQKCGVCRKLLWQKSPWSTRRIMRGDFPIAGVLACSHVFHVECLEQMTPINNTHEPPCPLCLNMIGAMEEPSPVTLQTALRSLRSRGVPILEERGNNLDNKSSNRSEDKLRGNWLWAPSQEKPSGARRIRSNRRPTLKGNVSRIFFGSKAIRESQRDLSSSNNRQPLHLGI